MRKFILADILELKDITGSKETVVPLGEIFSAYEAKASIHRECEDPKYLLEVIIPLRGFVH